MRFDVESSRSIDRFDSVGFCLAPLVRGTSCRIGTIYLAPGGCIGRHRAVGTQLLAVVTGIGEVAGGDGIAHRIEPGLAAVWGDGEEHETRTDDGLTAIVVEGEGLDVAAPHV